MGGAVNHRLSLSDALTMASGVVAARTPRPVLLCLKLVAKKSGSDNVLQISATDGEIGLVISVPNVDIKEEGDPITDWALEREAQATAFLTDHWQIVGLVMLVIVGGAMAYAWSRPNAAIDTPTAPVDEPSSPGTA